MVKYVNDTKMLRFRESFRGYNKDDVNAYIEQIHMKFSRRESELRAQITDLQMANQQIAASASVDGTELAVLKAALTQAKAETDELKSQLEQTKAVVKEEDSESAEKSKLYDTMSAQVGNILIVANSNAEKILNEAKAEAEKLKADAAFEAEKTKLAAEEKMNAMIAALDEKLKSVSERCIAEYETLVSEAKDRFCEITDSMKARSNELLSVADLKSQELEKQIASEYTAMEIA